MESVIPRYRYRALTMIALAVSLSAGERPAGAANTLGALFDRNGKGDHTTAAALPGLFQKPLPAGTNAFTWANYYEQKRRWLNEVYLGDYDKYGRHSDKWDAKARDFLKTVVEYRANEDGTRPDGFDAAIRRMHQLAKELQDDGCSDPMLLYCCGWLLNTTGKDSTQAESLVRKGLEGLETSLYPRFLAFCAARRLQTLCAAGEAVKTEQVPILQGKKMRYLGQAVSDKLFQGANQRFLLYEAATEIPVVANAPNPIAVEAMLNEIAASAGSDPWLRHMYQGICHLHKALQDRVDGQAKPGISESDEISFRDLRLARESLVKAHELHPEYPEAATLLIAAAAASGNRGEAVNWFYRAVSAQFDCYAYAPMKQMLDPSRDANEDDLYQYGLRCLETKRYDTLVPYQFYAAVWAIGIAHSNLDTVAQQPGVYDHLREYFEGAIAYARSRDPKAPVSILQTEYAVAAWQAGRYDEARSLLDSVGDKFDGSLMNNFKVTRRMMVGEIRARTGPHKELVGQAETLFSGQAFSNALPIYRNVAAQTPADDDASVFLRNRIAMATVNGLPSGVSRTPHYDTAQDYAGKGLWQQAYDEFVKSAETETECTRGWDDPALRAFDIAVWRLGKMQEGVRQTELTIQKYEKALAQSPDMRCVYFYGFSMACLHLKLGELMLGSLHNVPNARAHFQKCVELLEQYPSSTIYFSMACLQEMLWTDTRTNERKKILDKMMAKLKTPGVDPDMALFWHGHILRDQVLFDIVTSPEERYRTMLEAWTTIRDWQVRTGGDADEMYLGEFTLGECCLAVGRLPEAAEHLEVAVRLTRSAIIKAREMQSLDGQGTHYGNVPREAMSAAPALVAFMDTLATAYEKLHQPEKAYASLKEAVQTINETRGSLRSDEMKVLWQGGAFWRGGDYRKLYDRTIRMSLTLKQPEKTFEYMEMWKARSTLDLLGSREVRGMDNMLTAKEKERQLQLAKVDEIQQRLSTEKRGLVSTNEVASLQRSLVLIKNNADRLKEDIVNTRKEMQSLKAVSAVSLPEVQGLLGNATLVEFWSPNLAAIITTNSIQVEHIQVIPQKVEEFCAAVAAEGTSLRGLEVEKATGKTDADTNRQARTQALGKELYDAIIRPIEKDLKTEIVYISTDQPLMFLPFQALYDGAKYFVEKHALAYTPSASVLKYCVAKRKPFGGKVLALGNPNLRQPEFKLVHAEEEVKAIGKLFPDSKVLVGNDASETAARLLAGDYDIVHFACHGKVDVNEPMLSCLMLAPDKANDGFLHAGETFDLRLNAGLVTLSACDSGRGQTTAGGELLGLTRAFLFAGTPSVVASLWKVDDAATANLMVRFYEGLKTQDKARALQAAQCAMIAQNRSPFYWAGFCLYGDYF